MGTRKLALPAQSNEAGDLRLTSRAVEHLMSGKAKLGYSKQIFNIDCVIVGLHKMMHIKILESCLGRDTIALVASHYKTPRVDWMLRERADLFDGEMLRGKGRDRGQGPNHPNSQLGHYHVLGVC